MTGIDISLKTTHSSFRIRLLSLRFALFLLSLFLLGKKTLRKPTSDLANGTGRCRDCYHVIAFYVRAFDAVAWGKESVEALDKRWVSSEQGRDAVDDSGRVDADVLAFCVPTATEGSDQ